MLRARYLSGTIPRARHISPLRRRHYASSTSNGPLPVEVKMTTLPNRVRVATQPMPGHFASVGVYIDVGCRHENEHFAGVSHILDRMAFKSTKLRSTTEMTEAIDKLGGQLYGASSREGMVYQSTHFPHSNSTAVSLLADTILNPLFLPEEVETQREAARYEVQQLAYKSDTVLHEAMHYVAYGGETLGNTSLCPEEQIDKINADMLRAWTQEWYRPERIVITGAGLPHEELVELAEKHFGLLQSSTAPTVYVPTAHGSTHIPPLKPYFISPGKPSLYKTLTTAASTLLSPKPRTDPSIPLSSLAEAPARYKGGTLHIPTRQNEFDYVFVAFEGPSATHSDVYAAAVMQMLLGGGGSFSSGGPGKGLYSRLYTQVLNHYYTVDHCASFHHLYKDSSLFGLYAWFDTQESMNKIIAVLAHQLATLLYEPVNKVELSRAKKQLQSSVAMTLESVSVNVEDMGRQLITTGSYMPIHELNRKIDEVTAEDIQRVAHQMFGAQGKQPTIVGMGGQDVNNWKGIFTTYGVGPK